MPLSPSRLHAVTLALPPSGRWLRYHLPIRVIIPGPVPSEGCSPMNPKLRSIGVLTLLIAVAVAAGQEPKANPPADENKLPPGARLRLGSNKFREPNYVSAASLSPDGKTLAVCGGSQMVRFLDVATGKEVRKISVREYLRTNQLLWSPDGTRIVTAGYNGINVWDAKDGKVVKQAQNPNRDGRDGMIHMSTDGKFVAVGSQYDNGQVKVVDLPTGSVPPRIKRCQSPTVKGHNSTTGAQA